MHNWWVYHAHFSQTIRINFAKEFAPKENVGHKWSQKGIPSINPERPDGSSTKYICMSFANPPFLLMVICIIPLLAPTHCYMLFLNTSGDPTEEDVSAGPKCPKCCADERYNND